MELLWKDLRVALRGLQRSRAFTAAAALTLALGIGANAAIFTVLHAVFLRALPVEDPATLMALHRTFERDGAPGDGVLETSFLNYRDLSEQTTSFSRLAAFAWASFNLAPGGEPETVQGLFVTGNYFAALGLRPSAGRFFRPEEDATRGTHPVVVLSHTLWQRRFRGEEAVGATVRLNGRGFTVVGVGPPGFRGTNSVWNADLWVPVRMLPALNPGLLSVALDDRGYRIFELVGRLAPGVGPRQAEEETRALALHLAAAYPKSNRYRSFELRALTGSNIYPRDRPVYERAGQVLMTAVALVLVIACANVAHLLLARARGRTKEIGMRLALGARRGDLMRPLLVESVVLASLGGVGGWALAVLSSRFLWSLRPPSIAADAIDLRVDLAVLAFVAAVTLLTGLAAGLAPALQASRQDPVAAIRARGAGPPGRFSLRHALVAVQVAVSLVSLVAAGSFVASLRNVLAIDPGFDSERLAVVSFDAAGLGYDEERGGRFYEELLREASALPGVSSASLAASPPFTYTLEHKIRLQGEEDAVGPEGLYLPVNRVSPRYFATLGLRTVEGGVFVDSDRAGSPDVAVVNETLAERFWPGQSAVGQRILWSGQDWEVVGVVRDMKYQALHESPSPYAYRPLAQAYDTAVTLHLRAEEVASGSLLPAARRLLRELAPDLAVADAATVAELLQRSTWARSMGASLLGAFAAVALALAAVGVYGVLAQVVLDRRRELAIRVALGARPVRILGRAMGYGMLPVAIGLGAGSVAALGASRLFGDLIYGLEGGEPWILVPAAALLAAAAALACLVPARRALRLDTAAVLKAE